MGIEVRLHEEIEGELIKLEEMRDEIGTEKHKVAVDGLTKVLDRAIEMDKVERELREKERSREIENEFKAQQLKDERRDRLVKNILAVAGIIVPTALTVWGTFKTFKFEEEGTITTSMGRGFIGRLFPKK